MSDSPLTPRQIEVLQAIYAYVMEHQAYPNMREMCRQLGIGSTNGLMCHINGLRRKGYLEWRANRNPAVKRGNEGCTRITGLRLSPVIEASEAGDRLRAALGLGAAPEVAAVADMLET